jgi:phage gp46-like protein
MLGQNNFTEEDQHEWHGNLMQMDENEEELGSLLYTLKRAPLNPYTAKLAEHYAHQALQTLVRQGRCSGFDILVEVHRAEGRINMRIEALGTGERKVYSADLFALR